MTATARDELLLKIDKKVGSIDQQLQGNGNKGVFDRLEEIEGWQESHPKECPVVAKRKKVLVARSLEIAVAVGVFKGLDLLLKFVQAKGWL
ncbi:hypothetical protein LCGC14_2858690 [marine sediment metagenome]|uniref:Uncharacterized protein n=1 Tax=marine sediment metagenome TaxID=412755 RepID=A0A0F9AER4_9ZZZZ